MLKLHQVIKEAQAHFKSAEALFESQTLDALEVLIEMPIDTFLLLAKKGHSDKKEARVKGLLDKGEKFNSLPYFRLSGIKIIGHEGRHRARALKALGYYSMPVKLIMREGQEYPKVLEAQCTDICRKIQPWEEKE
jgi:hypothetical protein